MALFGRRKRAKERKRKEVESALVVPGLNGVPLAVYPHPIVDSLRVMMSRIERYRYGETPKRIALISTLRGEGVTYLSRALGAMIAHDYKRRVCVIELNWWTPSADMVRNAQQASGVAAVLAGRAALGDVLIHTGMRNLFVLPAGIMSMKERPVIARSNLLPQLLDKIGDQFDHIILDIPAVQATGDAVPLAALADGCCFVVHQGVTRVSDARRALDEISHLEVLGVVMNRVNIAMPKRLNALMP